MHSVFAYLLETISIFDFAAFTSVTSWNAYDPFTGEFMYKMTDVPSGSRVYSPKGEIYIYTVNLAQDWMPLWYSSRTAQPQNTTTPDDGSWGSVVIREELLTRQEALNETRQYQLAYREASTRFSLSSE